MRIVILGGTGMLGHACVQHFLSSKHDVFVSKRHIDVDEKNTFTFNVEHQALDNIPNCDYIINCIGLIRHHQTATEDMFYDVNASFVTRLAEWCDSRSTRMIHISTDSVFSGKRGMYVESDIPDPIDAYGESKLAGEGTTFMCIRTSTIGEEIRGKLCIVEWLKRQTYCNEQPIYGYVNQFWNGITAKEYAKMCDRIITDDLYVKGIRHVYANVMTKYQLLIELNKLFKLNLCIKPLFLDHKVDRTLISEYDFCRKLNLPSLEEMIRDMK